jgi:hypothetical protein
VLVLFFIHHAGNHFQEMKTAWIVAGRADHLSSL